MQRKIINFWFLSARTGPYVIRISVVPTLPRTTFEGSHFTQKCLDLQQDALPLLWSSAFKTITSLKLIKLLWTQTFIDHYEQNSEQRQG